MSYTVKYDKRADLQLEKMDTGVRRLILVYRLVEFQNAVLRFEIQPTILVYIDAKTQMFEIIHTDQVVW
jgi:hypothetical protein